MADISNVINVAFVPEGNLAARDNLNVTMIITSDDTVLSSAERYRTYVDVASVATDFGTSSDVYAHALAYFGTTPNPVNAGGHLLVGFWRAADETVAASAATLTGAELSEAVVIPQLQSISDGSFDIDIDGATENITGMDFRVATTLSEVATIIDDELTGGSCTLSDDNELVITSATTGATSLITVVSTGAAGTFVGNILALASGTGAIAVQGAAASVLSAETKLAAITELKAQTNMYGAIFIDTPTSGEAAAIAAWAQAERCLVYDVFNSSDNLEIDVTNVVWANKLAGYKHYRMLYSAAGNRLMGTSYMARAHTVNFAAENSALTMHLKQLSVTAESYTQTEITKAKNVGLDIYTTIKNEPVVLCSGANGFTDDEYNLLGFLDAVETDTYNLLKATGTKIPQTTKGVNQLVDSLEKTTRGFVRCGVFAPGTWSSPDSFGDIDVFNRAIETQGFYFLAGRLSDQSQADRQARKSPVIQGAVKFSGAIHSVDIIINYNF